MHQRLLSVMLFATLAVIIGGQIAYTGRPNQGILQGMVTIAACPVVIEGVPCEVEATAYENIHLVIYSADHTARITEIALDRHGHYQAHLPPGSYLIDLDSDGMVFSKELPAQVTIGAGTTIRLDIPVDTGIR